MAIIQKLTKQGALSDQGVEDIFNTKMKATSDGLYFHNGISSGIILQ